MRRLWRFTILIGAGFLLTACHQNTTLFAVDTTADTVDANAGDGLCADSNGDCSLRAAVMEANALPGVEEIRLADGATYVLSIVGAGEDAAATGDLDVTEAVVITGAATIDANGIDRVFHVDLPSGLAEIDGPDLTGGSAATGAAVQLDGGSVTVLDSNVYANTVVGAPFSQGAPIELAGAGTSYLWSSTVHGNTSDGASAGVLVASGKADIQNATITANTATSAFNPSGGIAAIGATVEIRFSTIVDSIGPWGEVGQFASTVNVRGSVIGNCGPTINTLITSLGGNIVESATCSFTEPGDQQGVAAMLGSLADNGGSVLTRAPLAGSPAIDNAGQLPCTLFGLDARDISRPGGAACDSGAVEIQPSPGADCTPFNPGPGADLRYCDLSGLSLDFVDLNGADLTGANLAGASLIFADLGGATLDGAALDNATLTDASVAGATADGATFSGAIATRLDITGAQLAGADLVGIQSQGISTVPASLPSGWVLGGSRLLGPGVDASGLDLSNSDLSGADFTGTDFTGATITGSTITGADFSGATIDGLLTGALVGTPAGLPPDFTVTLGWFVGPAANLVGADLTGADLRNRDLSGADFSGGVLDNVLFDGADLRFTTFDNSSVNATDFVGADMYRLHADTVDGVPILPAGWVRERRILFGPGADISGIERNSTTVVDGADLTDILATDTRFNYFRLFNVTGTGADFSRLSTLSLRIMDSDLASSSFADMTLSVGFGFFIENSDLLGADFSGALVNSISGAHISGTELDGTDFDGALLSNLDGWANTGTPINLPASHRYEKGLLIDQSPGFSGAVVSGLDLSGIDIGGFWGKATAIGTDFSGSSIDRINESDLTNADLTEAVVNFLTESELGGTDFTDADLRDIDSGLNTGTPSALPAGWLYEGGALFGPWAQPRFVAMTGRSVIGADWTDIVRPSADFSDSAIANTDLRGADLSNGNFTNSNLFGSFITGTDFTGATWSNTTCPDGTNTDTNGGTCVGHDPVNRWEIVTDPTTTADPLSGQQITLGSSLVRPTLSYVAGATIPDGVGVDWYIDGVLFRDDDLNAPFEVGGGPSLPTGVVFSGQGGGAGNTFLLDPGIHTIRAEAATTAGPLSFTATFRVDEP